MAQYIDKAAVVAEIERLQDSIKATAIDNRINKEQAEAYKVCVKLRSFVEDTLEVKEVDFERDLSKYVSNGIHRFFPNVNDDYCKMDSVIWQDYVIETAKHFFELGLKAQKG